MSEEPEIEPSDQEPSDKEQADRGKQLLGAHMEKAAALFSDFLDTHGISLPVLAKAMEEFTVSVFDLPEEAACTPGCAWCCHLRVGVSIPELLIIHNELTTQATSEGITYFQDRIRETAEAGDVLEEDFWYKTHPPCPFLNKENGCLIYPVRPFSCRAHHSLDADICRQGYEEKRQVMVPIFPLYRGSTDMYATIFIKVMAERGFASFQVGFVKGLAMLFDSPGLADAWLNGEDVFSLARIDTAT